MKIKLLVAPSMVVMIIVLLIWYVYPAYTDPIAGNGVRERSAELEKEKQALESIRGKTETINGLSGKLISSSMASKRELVMEYIPESMKEYEIIDNLNYLVLKGELSGTTISVSQPVNSSLASQPAIAVPVAGESAAPPSFKPQATLFLVDLSVQGNYEKIKNVFEKIYGLKRFNRIVSFKVSPAETGNSGTDNLKALAVLEFAYLKESGVFSSIDDPVLDKKDFDNQVISSIENGKSTALLDLQVDQKGKTSPFLP